MPSSKDFSRSEIAELGHFTSHQNIGGFNIAVANAIFLIYTNYNMQILQRLKQGATVGHYLLVRHELLIGSLMLNSFRESIGDVLHDEVEICALGVVLRTCGSSMKKNLCSLTMF